MSPQWAIDYPHRKRWQPGDVVNWLSDLLERETGVRKLSELQSSKLVTEDPPNPTN